VVCRHNIPYSKEITVKKEGPVQPALFLSAQVICPMTESSIHRDLRELFAFPEEDVGEFVNGKLKKGILFLWLCLHFPFFSGIFRAKEQWG
jgi:hypothetical protein